MGKHSKFVNVFAFTLILLSSLCLFIAILPDIIDATRRIYYGSISTSEFSKLAEKYQDFTGMDIELVIPLLSKGHNVFILTREATCMGYSYDELITHYPELALDGERDKLYCIPVHNSRSPEETFPKGFFVNEYGVIIEPYISLSIYW